jgi:hypothetical protein
MKPGQIRVFAIALLAAAALALASAACRSSSPPAENITAGEPERYVATVVRTFESGDHIETITEETSRLGELRRHEWSEQGETRVLILRPDLGKPFLLAVERQVYTETDLSRDITDQAIALNAKGGDGIDPVAIERMFEASDHPARVEVKLLPDQVIEGHSCQVAERRLIFDGRAEIIRTYLARDLSGLALKIEMESEPSTGLRFVTERRNIRVDVPQDLFEMPPGFKKVDKLEIP